MELVETLITPVAPEAQDATLTVRTAALSAAGGLTASVAVLVFPQASVTRTVWEGLPVAGTTMLKMLLVCGPASNIVLSKLYSA